jgi:hypothetical protein
MSHARSGYNREHVFEPGPYWDRLKIPALVRHHPAHIIHMPIDIHNRMNAQLPQMAVMSDRLGRYVLDWANHQELPHPEDGWQVIEDEALMLDRLGKTHRGRMLGH